MLGAAEKRISAAQVKKYIMTALNVITGHPADEWKPKAVRVFRGMSVLEVAAGQRHCVAIVDSECIILERLRLTGSQIKTWEAK